MERFSFACRCVHKPVVRPVRPRPQPLPLLFVKVYRLSAFLFGARLADFAHELMCTRLTAERH
jgi:hypothetical protein